LGKFFQQEEIKLAIVKKYGSVENYAKQKGVTKQAMYERIRTCTKKFLIQLREDGIISNELVVEKPSIAYGEKLVLKLFEKIELLEDKITELETTVKELREENELLKEENRILRVQFTNNSEVDAGKKKINKKHR